MAMINKAWLSLVAIAVPVTVLGENQSVSDGPLESLSCVRKLPSLRLCFVSPIAAARQCRFLAVIEHTSSCQCLTRLPRIRCPILVEMPFSETISTMCPDPPDGRRYY
ncbi:hypothetical protein BKA93DRAFT_777237 [Sparassis latifolia]